MARGDKKGALFAMKKKKLYEKEIEKISNVKLTCTLETQQMNLESAAHNAETFKAMHNGTSAMKKIRKTVGIDRVDNMMNDMREEMEATDEISGALAQPLDPLMEDDDDLLAELDQLEMEDLQELDSRLPSAPWGTKKSNASQKDRLSNTFVTKSGKVALRAW